jgi:hypothetical protein
VTPQPLPPHERTWRHPSELAAAERNLIRLSEPHPATRVIAVVGGTLGLLAIGALLVTVTPRRLASPVAVSATSTPPLRASAALARLATPIGDGKRAIMTLLDHAASVFERGSEIDVRLASGPTVTAVVERSDQGVLVVTLHADGDGHAVARSLPEPDELVTVLSDPPVTVPFSQVGSVDAEDGTPVLDSHGALVGLCEKSADNRMRLLDVTAQDDGAGGSPGSAVNDSTVVATTVAP